VPNDPTGPSRPTVKRLFAHSGNRCAFPRCTAALFEGATGIGEICHIKAAKLGGPRYDAQQTPAERHGYDNLFLLCGKHHTVIDDDEEAYTVERLLKMKAEHEQRAAPVDDDAFSDRAAQFLIDQPVISVNQSGGLTAHTINYYLPTGAPPVHERQVETLRKLVRHLCEARDWFKDTVRRARFEADPSMDECCRQCLKAAVSAKETLADGLIFIPRDLADECDGFFNTLSQGLTDFACARDPNTADGPPRGMFWDKAAKTAYEELPTRLEQIEGTARNLVTLSGVTPATAESKQFEDTGTNGAALSDEELETLEAMTTRPFLAGRAVFPKDVAGVLEIHPERARYIMEKLESRGLLFAAHNYKHGTSWGVSSNGRAELVKRHLL
jgi:hypothetical protein